MEEEKEIKIGLLTAVLLIVFLLLIIAGGIYAIYKSKKAISTNTNSIIKSGYESNNEKQTTKKNIKAKTYNGQVYYLIEDDYDGEYDLQFLMLSEYFNSGVNLTQKFNKEKVMDFSEYKNYCEEWNVKQKYTDTEKNYIVFSYVAYDSPILQARLGEVEYNKNSVNLYLWDDEQGVTADISAYVLVIPTDKNISKINIIPLYTEEEYSNLKKYNSTFDPNQVSIDKPIIYLYPTKDTNVSVKLLNDKSLTCTYPKYNGEWNVIAKPNGDLKDLNTNRELYSLYYESKSKLDFKIEKDGFIVKGENTSEFLEEKLSILGLTPREAEEFIVYWLPKLEANKYNYIRFASSKEINENMPLDINPNPDTIIRVLMTFKGLDNPIEVKEQELITPQRTGFVVVEWGGTEIK